MQNIDTGFHRRSSKSQKGIHNTSKYNLKILLQHCNKVLNYFLRMIIYFFNIVSRACTGVQLHWTIIHFFTKTGISLFFTATRCALKTWRVSSPDSSWWGKKNKIKCFSQNDGQKEWQKRYNNPSFIYKLQTMFQDLCFFTGVINLLLCFTEILLSHVDLSFALYKDLLSHRVRDMFWVSMAGCWCLSIICDVGLCTELWTRRVAGCRGHLHPLDPWWCS